MNVSKIFVTAAAAVSVFAAIGCTSTQRDSDVATAEPSAQVAPPEAMPSHPAVQTERTAETAAPNDAPATVAQEPAMTTPTTEAMPSHPALQTEPIADVAPTNDTPATAAEEPASTTPSATADFTERAPRADRN
jgi:hypothetical protein